jgi:hypothetical protein
MESCLSLMAHIFSILQRRILLGVETMITTIWTGHKYNFEWPEGATKPTWNAKSPGDVVGGGLM